MTLSPATVTSSFNAWRQQLQSKLRTLPGIPVIFAGALSVALVVVLALWAKAPEYKALYNTLSDQDGGLIISSLNQMNVPYKVDDKSGALMVPAESVRELRLKLAEQGLPKGGSNGFELLDNEKFGISQFSEQVNFQRALEGELERTIESLSAVKTARVHLALPKPSVFIREEQLPSASVTLELRPARALDDGQVNAIVHMVSSSVSRLPPGNVTVIDQNGNLLTSPGLNGQGPDRVRLKYAAEVERNIRQRIENILAPMVGAGNVRAQVTAQINFDRQEQTEERYGPNATPDKKAIRSQQTSDNQQNGGALPGGVPGALTNQPSPAATAPITTPVPATGAASAQGKSATPAVKTTTTAKDPVPINQQSSHDATTNYELDKTVLHTRLNSGTLRRLSVAVVVNYQQDDKGVPRPLPAGVLKQIEALTREAMGFSEQRGDSLNLVNAQFTPDEDKVGRFWEQPEFMTQMISAGRWLVVALVAFLLYRKVVRPVIDKQKQIRDEENAAAETTPPPEEPQDNGMQETARKAQQRINSEILSQRVREMSENDPQIVALLIRGWMGNEL
ncbi:flagellar basal-body MS-ring/collar protein FliF [Tatumella terrea]|uniref:flagellar basal-body MS-ring/collar protein FliF n=1 Tax=Tatumella terrea TaxID=419007 RepID=UPI0031E2B72F